MICSNCGIRAGVRGKKTAWVCWACYQYKRRNGTERPASLEAKRRARADRVHAELHPPEGSIRAEVEPEVTRESLGKRYKNAARREKSADVAAVAQLREVVGARL
jgi:hypothetical protein